MENLVALTCPNCGAAATNHKNCEFCGSLLVRFADRGIKVVSADYMSNLKVLPGLIESLQQNLDIQKELPKAAVATDVFREVSIAKAAIGGRSILSSIVNSLVTQDNRIVFPETINDDKLHLMVTFLFDRELLVDRQTHDKFKQLGAYDLFTCNNKGKLYEYAIDFGEDAEGAARILSEVLHKVYGVAYGTQLDYKTTFAEEDEDINALREDNLTWFEQYKWWIVTGVLLINWLISLLGD